MERGFQIEIQKGLKNEERIAAIEFANWFVNESLTHDMSWRHLTNGGWGTNWEGGALRRGGKGWSVQLRGKNLNEMEIELIFRRASKNRRIFQIVRKKLFGIGQDKVTYGEIPTEFYCRYGEIKG